MAKTPLEPRNCSAPGCDYWDTPGVKSTYLIRQLCPFHYQRDYRNKSLAPTICTYPGCTEPAQKWRRCEEHRGSQSGPIDLVEQREKTRRWREGIGRDKWLAFNRKQNLKRTYGLTPEEYDDQFERQQGVCAICGEPENSERFAHMAVDHDHESGELRGLLCHRCNKAIGLFHDDSSRLEKASAYLQRGGVWSTEPVERMAT